MAPAQAASASVGTDSIKGLAQSVARPAYRRLLVAEPALRRAVPILIIAFLVTMAVGAMVQINDQRRQTVAGISRDLEVTAELLATQLERDIRGPRSELMRRTQETVDALARNHGVTERIFLVTDSDGTVIATAPKSDGSKWCSRS